MKHLVVLTGAGVSAESGIRTFRDTNGLWEDHRVEDVASPEGFARNPALVLDFYNQRRAQARTVLPNAAHQALADFEEQPGWRVSIITQNVDDLHERAGSSDVLHLHGMLSQMRSVADENTIYDCLGDINIGDLAPMATSCAPTSCGLAKWCLPSKPPPKSWPRPMPCSSSAPPCKCTRPQAYYTTPPPPAPFSLSTRTSPKPAGAACATWPSPPAPACPRCCRSWLDASLDEKLRTFGHFCLFFILH